MAPLDDARARLMARATRRTGVRVAVAEAGHRVLAEAVRLPSMPPCATAGIDGLAIVAATSEGATDYAPQPIVGRLIAAGSPLPHDTDAIMPPWAFDEGPVALASVAGGSFVIPAGLDAPAQATLETGTILRPLHLALLAQARLRDVWVIERPRILLEAPNHLTPMLNALVQAQGALVAPAGEADLVLRLGEDQATWSDRPPPLLLSEPGAPEITLPAHPLRCFVLFAVLVAPALRRMGGYPEPPPIAATLARKITSGLGQVDAVPVRVGAGLATPLGPADGCGLLAAAAANGLLLVPENSEGYAEGAMVEITPLG